MRRAALLCDAGPDFAGHEVLEMVGSAILSSFTCALPDKALAACPVNSLAISVDHNFTTLP